MRPLLLEIVRTTATLLLGLFAGGVFFTVLAPSLRGLPGPAYVRYWQALNTDYGRAMPVLLLTCLALLLATCVLSYQRGWLVFGLSIAALLLVTGTIVLSVTQLEPLNQLANSWNADQPPTGWADARERWWNLHTARTVMAVLAFAGLLIAQAVDRGSSKTVNTADSAIQPARVSS
ncbi:anthrone oxygenase family protein [Streptosporangium sp. NPDC002607]